jgi:hypothetical protein
MAKLIETPLLPSGNVVYLHKQQPSARMFARIFIVVGSSRWITGEHSIRVVWIMNYSFWCQAASSDRQHHCDSLSIGSPTTARDTYMDQPAIAFYCIYLILLGELI